MGFVVAFSYLLQALVRDWRVAALGGFLLVFSGGMAMQMRMLRTGTSIRRIVHDCAIDADGRGNARNTLVAAGSRWLRQPPGHAGAGEQVQILFLIGALPILLIPGRGRQGEKNYRHGPAGNSEF
jgi:hypothetical protein